MILENLLLLLYKCICTWGISRYLDEILARFIQRPARGKPKQPDNSATAHHSGGLLKHGSGGAGSHDGACCDGSNDGAFVVVVMMGLVVVVLVVMGHVVMV